MDWYVDVIKKYAVFDGRANLKEYWFFVLFNVIITIVLGIIDRVIGTFSAEAQVGLFGTVYGLAIMLPSVAVGVRRLHDTDRSGWWLLLVFIPCIGVVVLILFLAQEGTSGQNRYGARPPSSL